MTGLTYNLSVNLQLPRSAPPNLPPETRNAFQEVYTGLNNMAVALVTLCGAGPRSVDQWATLAGSSSTLLASNANRFYALAGEDLAYGDIINVYSNAGIVNVRKANATNNTKPADGFCNTPSGILTGTPGEVILSSGLLPATGLTIGHRYFLSTTSGFMSAGPAVAAGNIEQYLGVAVATTALNFNCGYWIQH